MYGETPFVSYTECVNHVVEEVTTLLQEKAHVMAHQIKTSGSPSDSPPRGFYFFLFFLHTIHLLSSFWTSRGHRCLPFSPPVLAFIFYRTWGSAIPLLVDFSSSVANSRSRAFRKSICAQEKVPTNLHEYALGGI